MELSNIMILSLTPLTFIELSYILILILATLSDPIFKMKSLLYFYRKQRWQWWEKLMHKILFFYPRVRMRIYTFFICIIWHKLFLLEVDIQVVVKWQNIINKCVRKCDNESRNIWANFLLKQIFWRDLKKKKTHCLFLSF